MESWRAKGIVSSPRTKREASPWALHVRLYPLAHTACVRGLSEKAPPGWPSSTVRSVNRTASDASPRESEIGSLLLPGGRRSLRGKRTAGGVAGVGETAAGTGAATGGGINGERPAQKTPARLDPRHTVTDTWDQSDAAPTTSATDKSPKLHPTRQIHVAAAASSTQTHSGRTAIRTERNQPTNKPKKKISNPWEWMDGWVGWWWAHRAAPLLVRIPILERKAQDDVEAAEA